MWTKIRAFFKDSETIFLARLQTLVGLVFSAWLALDHNAIAQYIESKWIPVYLIGAGILTEVARRYRATDLK